MSFLSSPIRPTSSRSPAHPRSGSHPWSNDPRLVDLHDRYRWYTIHVNKSIKAARAGISEARVGQLYHEAEAEMGADPAKYPYPGEYPTDAAGRATWWRKCDAVCNFPAERFVQTRTNKEHMIQWWTAFMATNVISNCELDGRNMYSQLLKHANDEATKVTNPNLGVSEPPAGALEEPNFLDWVGASFRERGTGLTHYVEDAGNSLVRGEYFLLRTPDGNRKQVSLEEFKKMADGLVPEDA
ncbi:hypothetical protein FA95DRAFT_560779 [Auriscalpium vulgare]|uniref:Uncharacterized protein n=1 Tax=Auriscalpium vulgare TaxID=40419 RepID=A0ACB8RE83_9AGAM|nr:hypothetical protein FA95DRAFT_560779 [Auriscalpium vulgare]